MSRNQFTPKHRADLHFRSLFKILVCFSLLTHSLVHADFTPLTDPQIRNSAYKVTPQAVEVDGRMGTIAYSVPIVVPPGRNGMVPKISLQYSSLQKISPYGYGWRLSGLSQITRSTRFGVPCYGVSACEAVRVNNKFFVNGKDRFELDGSLLVEDPSTPNRFYTESFQSNKIVFEASNNRWILQEASGNQSIFEDKSMQYASSSIPGGTPLDVIQGGPAINPNGTSVWVMTKSIDNFGNTIEVSYSHNKPLQIRYNGHNSSPASGDLKKTVNFVWERGGPKNKTGIDVNRYASGSSTARYGYLFYDHMRLAAVVSGVDINSDGQINPSEIFSERDLVYDDPDNWDSTGKEPFSKLIEVKTYGKNRSSMGPGAQLTFTYSPSFSGWESTPVSLRNPSPAPPLRGSILSSVYGDIPGMGIFKKVDPRQGSATFTHPQTDLSRGGHDPTKSYGDAELLDMNGDSLIDRVHLLDGIFKVYLGQMSFAGVFSFQNTPTVWTWEDANPYAERNRAIRNRRTFVDDNEIVSIQVDTALIDMDGDGLIDRIFSDETGQWMFFKNTGYSFAPGRVWSLPVTGPIAGLAASFRHIGFYGVSRLEARLISSQLVDVNGDGRPDHVLFKSTASIVNGNISTKDPIVSINNGSGFDENIKYIWLGDTNELPEHDCCGVEASNQDRGYSESTYTMTLDLNGDGLPDVARSESFGPYQDFKANQFKGYYSTGGKSLKLDAEGMFDTSSVVWTNSTRGNLRYKFAGDMNKVITGLQAEYGYGLLNVLFDRGSEQIYPSNLTGLTTTGLGSNVCAVLGDSIFFGAVPGIELPQKGDEREQALNYCERRGRVNLAMQHTFLDLNNDDYLDWVRVTGDQSNPVIRVAWGYHSASGHFSLRPLSAPISLPGSISNQIIQYATGTVYNTPEPLLGIGIREYSPGFRLGGDPGNSLYCDTYDECIVSTLRTLFEESTHSDLIDFNGDGYQDRVVVKDFLASQKSHLGEGRNKDWDVFYHKGGIKLLEVKNEIGGVTKIEYKNSATYSNTVAPVRSESGFQLKTESATDLSGTRVLSNQMYSVSKVTQKDGRNLSVNNDQVINHDYAGLRYDWEKKEFVGAKLSTTQNSKGDINKTYYLQKRGLRGSVDVTESIAENTFLNAATKTDYITQIARTLTSGGSAGVAINSNELNQSVQLTSTANYSVSRDPSSPSLKVQSATRKYIDPIYNRVSSEVSSGLDGVLGTPDDVSMNTYFPKDFGQTENILAMRYNYPVQSVTMINGVIENSVKSYYDNQEFGKAPTKGSVTKKEALIDDANGLATEVFDRDDYGNTITYFGPESFKATGSVAISGATTTAVYDADTQSNIVSIKNRLGHEKQFAFDPISGELLKSMSADGNMSCAEFDDLYRITVVRKKNTLVSGLASSITDTCGVKSLVTTYSYNNFGDPVNQNVVTKTYDDKDLETGHSIGYFDGLARDYLSLSRKDNGWFYQLTEFDYLGRTSCSTDLIAGSATGLSALTLNCSNLYPNTKPKFDMLNRSTESNKYGSSGVLISKSTTAYGLEPVSGVQPWTSVSTTSFTGSTWAPDKVVTILSDGHGVRQVKNANSLVNVERDPLGRVLKFDGKDVNGSPNQMSFEYDKLGRKTKVTQVDTNTTWQYNYHPDGRISVFTSPRGGTNNIKYFYDSLGRLIAEDHHPMQNYSVNTVNVPIASFGPEDVTYEFENTNKVGLGQIKKISAPSQGVFLKDIYNNLGQVEKSEHSMGGRMFTFSKTLDRDGNLLTKTFPDGEVWTYSYTPNKNLQQVVGSLTGNILTGVTIDERGRLTKYNAGSASGATNINYNPLTKRLQSIVGKSTTGLTVQNSGHELDMAGNMNRVIDNTGSNNYFMYRYDNQHRLSWAAAYTYGVTGVSKQMTYQLSDAANLTSETLVNQPTKVYNRSQFGFPDPHAVTSYDGKYYKYDTGGNRLEKGIIGANNVLQSQEQYTWNYNDQLTQLITPTLTAEYKYDPSGIRIEKKVVQRGTNTKIEHKLYPSSDYEVDLITGEHKKHVFVSGQRTQIHTYKVSALQTTNSDGDAVPDVFDNCANTTNPTQSDRNSDNQGDACDADFNNDGIVNTPDFSILLRHLNSSSADVAYNIDADISPIGTPDGYINLSDFGVLSGLFGNNNIGAKAGPGFIKSESSVGLVALQKLNSLYLHNDYLGTPIVITDHTGATVQKTTLSPYGEMLSIRRRDANGALVPSSQSLTPYLFTGHELDQESGLYYAKSRYYDPNIKQFISKDPALFTRSEGVTYKKVLTSTDALNAYSYVEHQPTVATDPTGKSFELYEHNMSNVGLPLNQFGLSTQMNGSIQASHPSGLGFTLHDPSDATLIQGEYSDLYTASWVTEESMVLKAQEGMQNMSGMGVIERNLYALREAVSWTMIYQSMRDSESPFIQNLAEPFNKFIGEESIGRMDFGSVGIMRLTVVDGVGYNQFDLGNRLWGMGMSRLGISYGTAVIGSQLNAFFLSGHQNNFDPHPYLPQWNGIPAWTLDDSYDQQAIRQGYYENRSSYNTPSPFDF